MTLLSKILRSRTVRRVSEFGWLAPLVLVASCGGGGGGGGSSTPAATAAPTVDQLANVCTVPGEKSWEFAHLNDVYLFYRDIVPVDPNAYATPEAYFYALLVPSKDRFSFVEPQSVADAFFNAGQDVGYGGVFKFDSANKLRIGYVDAGGPLALQNVARGAEIQTIAGVAVSSYSTTALNTLLFPSTVGVSVTMTVVDLGQTVPRSITVASTNVVEDPVPLAQVLPLDVTNPLSSKVGYLLFNDHIATSESELITAINGFKSAGVSDVVVDLRYNGGGYLYIASELAYMLGGNRITTNAVFEKLTFNDKHPEKTNDPNNTVPFYATGTGGQLLPTLNLPRVFIITAPGTCSASESVINGLTPFVQVVRIGGTTCGKPYGFIQTNNCGNAYFAIQFEGVNNVGFGDYTAGFAPTCVVSDDFSRMLGDRNEGRLSATLAYGRSGTCPVTASSQESLQAATSREGTLGRPERQRRLMR
jgi:C-terminal processing protease CtpA/Prc